MKTDEMINALCSKFNQAMTESDNPNYEPNLAIYMEYDYWMECKLELKGQVSQIAYEFLTEDTMMGFQVWKVPPATIKDKHKKHPPFVIVKTN